MCNCVVEEWRSVVGHEGKYDVSSRGVIRSLPRERTRGGTLKQRANANGYLQVSVYRVGWRGKASVHLAVAYAFLGPRPAGMTDVRHLDGNSAHNCVANLEYSTHSVNLRDRRRHGTDHNVLKTHCPQGHEYSADNVYISRGTGRQCRTCTMARSALRRAA